MSYLTQEWEEQSVLNGSLVYSVLIDEENAFAVVYDDSFFGFNGIVTAFSDETLGFMGVLEGDWRREFDEIHHLGYGPSLLLFRKLFSEYGIGMVLN